MPNAAGWEVVSGGRQIPPVEREALTILIAEDEESIGEFLADLLSSEGYRVIVVADGRAALACARCERPAMILSDCMMPGLDGLQLVRELRRHPATRAIPVALMSSTRPRGLDLFAVPFLAKPFELIDVLDLIARCTDAPRNTQLYGEG